MTLHARLIGLCVFAAVFATNALAQSAPTSSFSDAASDAEQRNAALEKRVQELERKQLENDVEAYLELVPSFDSAQGADNLTPGSSALRISGQLRWRGEIRDHLYSDDPNGAKSFNLVRQRARLRFDLDVIENLEVTIEFQDVRLWGEAQSTVGDLEGVDVKRAFAQFNNLGGKPIDLQVGRQVLFYGDQRLVGHLEWVDQGRTYDGVRLKVHPEKYFLDVWAVNIRETGAVNDDRYFYGIYGGPKFLDLYLLGTQDLKSGTGETGASGNTFYATVGFRFHGKKGGFDYKVEVPFQFGTLNGDDLTAWAAAVTLGYTWENARWQPRLYFEFDYASGDKDPTDGDVEQFQTVYPTNHLYYGNADQVGWENIMSFRVGVVVKPTSMWSVRLDYFHFIRPEEGGNWVQATGATIRPGALGASSHLGDEFDLIITWKPSKPVKLDFGWTVFFPGGFIEETGASPTATFVWLQGRVIF